MDYKAISQQAGLKEKRVRIYGYYKNKYTLKRKKHGYEKREVRWPKHYVRENKKPNYDPSNHPIASKVLQLINIKYIRSIKKC